MKNKNYRRIYNYLSLRFSHRKVWDRIAYEYLKNCKTILDAGCGEGRFIFQNPNKIIGLDWNQESIKKCRDKGFNVIRADIKNLPFSDKSISGIHCSHVIEHFLPKDVYKILSEFNRVIKPGGILIIRTPLLWKGFYSDLSHIKPYNPKAITRYLTSYSALSNERTRRSISFDFKVVCIKWRYQPFRIKIKPVDLVFGALNRWGFPWLKRNGYMLVLQKASFGRRRASE